jgi:hypothetical protein
MSYLTNDSTARTGELQRNFQGAGRNSWAAVCTLVVCLLGCASAGTIPNKPDLVKAR